MYDRYCYFDSYFDHGQNPFRMIPCLTMCIGEPQVVRALPRWYDGLHDSGWGAFRSVKNKFLLVRVGLKES